MSGKRNKPTAPATPATCIAGTRAPGGSVGAGNVADADATRRAGGRIRLAVERAASRYPFHAKVLERFAVRPRPAVGTMAVTAAGDDVLLLFNAGFVHSITLDELVGVLLHEVHHVVLGHVLADPAEFPDWWARVVAEEATANEFVAEPLPGTPILLAQFPGLLPMESTRRRYGRLRRHTQRFSLAGLNGTAQVAAGAGAPGPGAVLDDHGVWAEALADRERAAAAVRAAVHDAAAEVGAEAVPANLRAALAAMGVGRMAGDGRYALNGTGTGSLPWGRLLRRYAGRHLRPRPDFRRPPRRFPRLVEVVPGRSRRAGRK